MESEITMKQIANSTALSDVTSMSSPFDNTIYTSLTLNNDLLSKNLNLCIPMDSHTENISSTLDISLISAQSHVSLESKDTQEGMKSNYLIMSHIRVLQWMDIP